jgi:two-component system, response regulator
LWRRAAGIARPHLHYPVKCRHRFMIAGRRPGHNFSTHQMSEKTILLIEDNPDDAELTLMALMRVTGAEDIVVAHDSVEALRYLLQPDGDNAEARPLPTVIFLDLKMPKINGIEVLQRLRAHERTRHLPVVMLTSSDEQQDILGAYMSGANSYIRKPVDSRRFNECLEKIGRYWLELNVIPASHGARAG